MKHPIRPWLVLTAILGCLTPVFGADPAPDPPSPDRPPAFVLPPPEPDYVTPHEGSIDGPLLERAEAPTPGFFFNAESSVLWPRVQSNELVGGTITPAQTSGVSPSMSVGLPPGAGIPITGDIVRLPGNRLDPAVSPRFEVGYRFPDGFGDVRLRYRFLDAVGSETVLVGPFGAAAQRGRLDLEFVDLDYGVQQFALGPDWEMRTAVGLRYATAFFDSQAVFLHPVTVQEAPFGVAPFTRLTQSEALGNWYLGAHGVLELARHLGCVPGLSLFGRLEGAGMWGRVHQTFRETFVEAPGFTEIRVPGTVGTPLLNSAVGLSYDVPQWNHCRFLAGYQFETWWQFGRGNNDQSFGHFTDQGLFLRGEFNF